MLHTLAVAGYRSLRDIVLPLGGLSVVTGANGSGKSSTYRALRLLAHTASGALVRSLAQEGGLASTLWAGPADAGAYLERGQRDAGARKGPAALRLGFVSDAFCYTIDLGYPVPSGSMFSRDPVIKRECVWRGSAMRPRALCADRRGASLRCRGERPDWHEVMLPLGDRQSMLAEFADPHLAPELILLRDQIRSWRFYDHMRTDAEAPARKAEVGTFTPALADDGADLAAAVQTILEIGDTEGFHDAIDHAFPGSRVRVVSSAGRLSLELDQAGMLRALDAAELSDGTLRFLLLAAALFTPRAPALMVMNEPETSLHPSLLPSLARMITRYAHERQLLVVTHARPLIDALNDYDETVELRLLKKHGETLREGAGLLDHPAWSWPAR